MQIRTQLAVAAFATIAATSTGAAFAGPAVTADAITPMVSVQTIAATSQRMPAADAAALAGTYDLSNGATSRVSYEGRRLYAEMGARKSELVPAGGTAFTARGTDLRLQFEQLPFATDVVLSGR